MDSRGRTVRFSQPLFALFLCVALLVACGVGAAYDGVWIAAGACWLVALVTALRASVR